MLNLVYKFLSTFYKGPLDQSFKHETTFIWCSLADDRILWSDTLYGPTDPMHANSKF